METNEYFLNCKCQDKLLVGVAYYQNFLGAGVLTQPCRLIIQKVESFTGYPSACNLSTEADLVFRLKSRGHVEEQSLRQKLQPDHKNLLSQYDDTETNEK